MTTDPGWFGMMNKFGSVSLRTDAKFVPETHFANEHWYEQYDPLREYESGEFDHDYGRGTLRYSLQCACINNVYYIVAKEVISREEIESLAEFCPCPICESAPYRLDMWLACSHCFGCFKSGAPAADCVEYVRVARERTRTGFVRTKYRVPVVYLLASVTILLVLLFVLYSRK